MVNIQGDRLGEVVRMIETGANDVLVVQGTDLSVDHQERLIPYVDDHIVRHVDLKAREMVVDWQKDFG